MRTLTLLLTFLAALTAAAGLAAADDAIAAPGDLYAPGTRYRATTYPGHANYHLWPNTAKEQILDLSAAQSADGQTVDNAGNLRLPVQAPGEGTVEQVSEGYGGGWGNSLIWTSADGREEIHVAHLDAVAKTGPVAAGDLIGYEGSTGYTSPSNFNHLHVSRLLDGAPAPVVLSGVAIEPDSHRTGRGNQRIYTAAGVEPAPTSAPSRGARPSPAEERPSTARGSGSEASSGESQSASRGGGGRRTIGGEVSRDGELEQVPLLGAYQELILS